MLERGKARMNYGHTEVDNGIIAFIILFLLIITIAMVGSFILWIGQLGG